MRRRLLASAAIVTGLVAAMLAVSLVLQHRTGSSAQSLSAQPANTTGRGADPRTARDFRLPTFQAPTASGDRFDSRSLGTDRTVLHVYASWCGVCATEAPHFAEFVRAHDDLRLVLLAVDDDAEPALAFARRYGWPSDAPIVLDPDREIAGSLGLHGQPHTLLVDDGRVVGRHLGPGDRDQLEMLVS